MNLKGKALLLYILWETFLSLDLRTQDPILQAWSTASALMLSYSQNAITSDLQV